MDKDIQNVMMKIYNSVDKVFKNEDVQRAGYSVHCFQIWVNGKLYEVEVTEQ